MFIGLDVLDSEDYLHCYCDEYPTYEQLTMSVCRTYQQDQLILSFVQSAASVVVVSINEAFVGCNKRRVPLGLGLIFLTSAYILKAKKVIQIAHGRGLFRGPSRGGGLIQLLFGVGTRQTVSANRLGS